MPIDQGQQSSFPVSPGCAKPAATAVPDVATLVYVNGVPTFQIGDIANIPADAWVDENGIPILDDLGNFILLG